ncbi:PREDICTED: eukaryotic elongation factor 2 kinase-like [Priapulus caudatus]|uniref:Eukaryotic elongation factor 2 kinase n=1 Tax=Priapulus caudatus TaxID=37621 RepID=A0ABM1EGY4_PRICU|nr:PREDICTED: eukaryotic elongation factor 2 kinase-like [Priapulus caudatus]XP_014671455.1 PREDICTED: eukaryotic elongation factor 2 kinase-like [Priapulus caudatus]XP_014671456.1 PREDICTED: eukaryotic elongation factor 2 kinase-like [Priapulus caudatus]
MDFGHQQAMAKDDPWADFSINELMTESVRRHRYSAIRKKWTTDEVQVKVEAVAFDRGAMRECFRLKKLSNFRRNENWQRAHNYVAKAYITPVERDVYFEDVKLQNDAKLWGEEYNRHNPPKKVDIMQMCVVEFVHREGSPLFHLEHYIEGEYIKYNSNSGFVSEAVRCTPQAFSHFTFERSSHHLIVVDIQGVGDLWTDPQIHSCEGTDYGDGNLCTKGMALFFHSHACNHICDRLGLTPFDLAGSELRQQAKRIAMQKCSETKIRGSLEICVSPSASEASDLHRFLRQRTYSGSSLGGCVPASPSATSAFSPPGDALGSPVSQDSDFGSSGRLRFMSGDSAEFSSSRQRVLSGDSDCYSLPSSRARTISGDSDTDSNSGTWSREEERIQYLTAMMKSRPAGVAQEIDLRELRDSETKTGGSTLGQIHLDLAKYHEMGRFSDGAESERDMGAAMFHLQQAAKCGVLEAILTLARLYLSLPTDMLCDVTIENVLDNVDRGIDYMLQAADAGDRSAMIYMAKAFVCGNPLGKSRSKDWKEAAYWYDVAINTEDPDENGEFNATMDDPVYQLQASQAEIWHKGGFGLEKDPSYAGELYTAAAEAAMTAMKGRLANKYYALAEEAWADVEE